MKKILLLTMFIIFLIPIATATSLEFIGNCTDADTLVISMNYTFNGSERDFLQDPIICPHGCVEGQGQYGDDCGPSPQEQNANNSGIAIAISIILSIMSIAFMYVSVNVSEKNGVLGWFFLPLSMIIMVVNLFVLTVYTIDAGITNILATTGYAIIIAIVFLMFYFMLFYFTKGFERLMNRDKEKFEDKLGV